MTDEPEPIEWADFLTNVPPPAIRLVASAIEYRPAISTWKILAPVLQLYCNRCDGEMNFDGGYDGEWASLDQYGRAEGYLSYTCRHCQHCWKKFALSVRRVDKTATIIEATKVGEIPFYFPHISKRLLDVIGEREMFFNGRRAEANGQGIGAFVYYRRLVDEQKNQFLDEILKVAECTRSKPEVVEALKAARAEGDFSRSVDLMKDAIPEQLRYNGKNPMVVLNTVLGHSIHTSTDAECLALARMARLILGFISEKTAEVLRDRKELDEAFAEFERKQGEKKTRPKAGG